MRDYDYNAIGSSSVLVQPLSPGSAYRTENKAVDRISGSSKASRYKKRSIVSIPLIQGNFLLVLCFSLHQNRGRANNFRSYTSHRVSFICSRITNHIAISEQTTSTAATASRSSAR